MAHTWDSDIRLLLQYYAFHEQPNAQLVRQLHDGEISNGCVSPYTCEALSVLFSHHSLSLTLPLFLLVSCLVGALCCFLFSVRPLSCAGPLILMFFPSAAFHSLLALVPSTTRFKLSFFRLGLVVLTNSLSLLCTTAQIVLQIGPCLLLSLTSLFTSEIGRQLTCAFPAKVLPRTIPTVIQS